MRVGETLFVWTCSTCGFTQTKLEKPADGQRHTNCLDTFSFIEVGTLTKGPGGFFYIKPPPTLEARKRRNA